MMKFISIILIAFAALAMTSAKKEKVVFFGDSITQAAVKKGGYIDLMNAMLVDKKLDKQYELIGAGVSGNKVYDLYLRMETDVLDKQPAVVFIYIGVNDVWHKTLSGTGTDIKKFEEFYAAIIRKLQAKKIRVILASAAVIGEKNDGTNAQDKDLDAYGEVTHKLATQFNCSFIDLRKKFIDYSKEHNPANAESGVLTTDRVHLNEKGNRLVAEEMMSALLAGRK
ncbi:MAG: family lipolytic protein [Ferruginibacter sp.]|nr:family lipolytic protein [Ferruginibacter sp.]